MGITLFTIYWAKTSPSLNEIMTVIIVGQNSHEMGDQALKSMKIIRFYDHGNKTTPSLHKTKKWNYYGTGFH